MNEPVIDLDNGSPAIDAESTVRTLLAAGSLAVSDQELAVLVAQYPMRKAGVELLHSMPEARYESPGLVFDATPTFVDWGSPS